MHTIKQLQELFLQELKATKYPGNPRLLYEPVAYIMDLGGKRMRPVLTLMGCELFGGTPQMAMPAAMAIEIFHNFTLVHDDIMDEAPIRRGKPTVHQKFNDNIAILSGDVMLVYAYQHLNQLNVKLLPGVLEIFNKTAIEVCEGQQYDMDFETMNDVTINQYLTMIEYKTAVLLGGALKIGAIIGGAEDKEAEKLYQFGRNLGLAFQLQDDYLDTFGDESKFGKQTGGDIIQNKKTYLILKALELAKSDQYEELKQLYYDNSVNKEEKVSRVVQIFKETNIPEIIENEIQQYTKTALEHLNAVQIDHALKVHLISFADMLQTRTT